MASRDKALTGAAGVFHVASVFSMRGMIALPTIRNTAGYDIIVSNPDGSTHANIQVKTSSSRVKFWPICQSIASVKSSPNDFYVLLRRTADDSGFEGFMLSGRDMKAELKGYADWCKSRGKKAETFSHCASLVEDENIAKWSTMWDTWTL